MERLRFVESDIVWTDTLKSFAAKLATIAKHDRVPLRGLLDVSVRVIHRKHGKVVFRASTGAKSKCDTPLGACYEDSAPHIAIRGSMNKLFERAKKFHLIQGSI